MMGELIAIPSSKSVHDVAVSKGWYDGITLENMGKHFIPAQLALITSEASEALEVYRGLNEEDFLKSFSFYDVPKTLSRELIEANRQLALLYEEIFTKRRVLFFAFSVQITFFLIVIQTAIKEKHEKNMERPYRHGNKII